MAKVGSREMCLLQGRLLIGRRRGRGGNEMGCGNSGKRNYGFCGTTGFRARELVCFKVDTARAATTWL